MKNIVVPTINSRKQDFREALSNQLLEVLVPSIGIKHQAPLNYNLQRDFRWFFNQGHRFNLSLSNLIELGADLNCEYRWNNSNIVLTPIEIAMKFSSLDNFMVLFDNLSQINLKNKNLVKIALNYDRFDIAKYLLFQGYKIPTDKNGDLLFPDGSDHKERRDLEKFVKFLDSYSARNINPSSPSEETILQRSEEGLKEPSAPPVDYHDSLQKLPSAPPLPTSRAKHNNPVDYQDSQQKLPSAPPLPYSEYSEVAYIEESDVNKLPEKGNPIKEFFKGLTHNENFKYVTINSSFDQLEEDQKKSILNSLLIIAAKNSEGKATIYEYGEDGKKIKRTLEFLDIVAMGADPNCIDDNSISKSTPITYLAKSNSANDVKLECMMALVKSGANLKKVNANSENALLILVGKICDLEKKDYTKKEEINLRNMIEFLIPLCDVNLKNNKGKTALDLILDSFKNDGLSDHGRVNLIEIAKNLMSRGAELGESFLTFASQRSYTLVGKFVNEHLAKDFLDHALINDLKIPKLSDFYSDHIRKTESYINYLKSVKPIPEAQDFIPETELAQSTNNKEVSTYALIDAIRKGDNILAKEILENLDSGKIYINQTDNSGRTALMIAAQKGNTEIVNLLLEKDNIDITKGDRKNQNALILAIKSGHEETALCIFRNWVSGASYENMRSNSLLKSACEKGFSILVRDILENMPKSVHDINSSLDAAILSGNLEIVESILYYSSKFNLGFSLDKALLETAESNPEAFRILNKYCETVNAKTLKKFVDNQWLYQAELILNSNVKIVEDYLGIRKNDLLKSAAKVGNLEFFKILSEKDDSLFHLSSDTRKELLVITAENDQNDISKYILEHRTKSEENFLPYLSHRELIDIYTSRKNYEMLSFIETNRMFAEYYEILGEVSSKNTPKQKTDHTETNNPSDNSTKEITSPNTVFENIKFPEVPQGAPNVGKKIEENAKNKAPSYNIPS